MHLDIAEKLRTHPALPQPVGALLAASWPAFYLGSIAADFQTICDMPRETTHFYPLPPAQDDLAYPRLFVENPELAQPDTLAPDQAAFVAAYIAHLLYDVRWFHQVLMPFFVTNPAWDGADRRERFTSHNTLLTYLDRAAYDRLPDSAETTLRAASTHNRARFIPDDNLRNWRDMIADQLQPDDFTRTVEIFATRLGMTPAAFAANLDDPAWMRAQVFDRVPLDEVYAVFATCLDDSVALITAYYANQLIP